MNDQTILVIWSFAHFGAVKFFSQQLISWTRSNTAKFGSYWWARGVSTALSILLLCTSGFALLMLATFSNFTLFNFHKLFSLFTFLSLLLSFLFDVDIFIQNSQDIKLSVPFQVIFQWFLIIIPLSNLETFKMFCAVFYLSVFKNDEQVTLIKICTETYFVKITKTLHIRNLHLYILKFKITYF